MTDEQVLASLPEDVREHIESYRSATGLGKFRPSVFDVEKDVSSLISFLLDQARIIHDLKEDSIAYARGVQEGYEKRKKEEGVRPGLNMGRVQASGTFGHGQPILINASGVLWFPPNG